MKKIFLSFVIFFLIISNVFADPIFINKKNDNIVVINTNVNSIKEKYKRNDYNKTIGYIIITIAILGIIYTLYLKKEY